jgi:FtsP/CotA-like multicopper oxidase with cupredoxin domain
MNNKSNKMSRRKFLRLGIGSAGVLTLSAAGVLAKADLLKKVAGVETAVPSLAPSSAPSLTTAIQPDPTLHTIRLGATDGFISIPGRDPLYSFGFVEAENVTDSVNKFIGDLKGLVQAPAPILEFKEGEDAFLVLTNLGLIARPDLDDAHTIHWHGFRNPTALFDGVPEVSIAVPVGRNFPYYFNPEHPGTYMYHCHFEDTEHVQMGMIGVVFVRPVQDGTAVGLDPTITRYVYNDGDGSTGFHREYTLMLTEIDTRPHDQLLNVQEFVWSDYDPNYWVINGRCYPDTVKLENDPTLPHQPISSLIQTNSGERILLRMTNLGYEQHAMHMESIPMQVVGHDAAHLRNGTTDLSYTTNTIYIGPGEARDVILTAPPYTTARDTFTDAHGSYNRYWFKNRNYHKLTNGGAPGPGGMMTEVRVYDVNVDPLPAQTSPNQTFPAA